jgi:hypothetical protein
MPNLQLLNPQEHARLRMRVADTATPHFPQVLASEFAAAASCCPVLFTKESTTGQFYAGAVFGFKPGENLLDTFERAGFRPLSLQRAGFYLSDRHIAIDRDHARFSETEGEPLFDEGRQPGNALRVVQKALGEIHVGLERTSAFIAALVELKLIEPVDISLQFDDGERLALKGLYTVSLDRLREVDDAAALALFRAGHLQLAYVMAASLRQIARLADLRSRRLSTTRPAAPG